jgi:predicted nucleic acid-binding protein
MILYLDASALVKRYVVEPGSAEVLRRIGEARAVGTVAISRAEVAAALAKAARFGLLTSEIAQSAHQAFRQDWPDFIRLPVTEPLLDRSADLAWDLGLRGYDAVQLAAGLSWQEALEAPVSFATFDRHLWAASGRAGLIPFPNDLPALLDSWKKVVQPAAPLPFVPLQIPQHRRGIEPRGAASGEVTGEEGHRGEDAGNGHEGERIGGADAEEDAGEETREGE